MAGCASSNPASSGPVAGPWSASAAVIAAAEGQAMFGRPTNGTDNNVGPNCFGSSYYPEDDAEQNEHAENVTDVRDDGNYHVVGV